MFSTLKSTFILSILIFIVHGRKICYEDYGCFIDTAPFGGTTQRPLAFLPDEPAKIGTLFTLYNRFHKLKKKS